MDWNFLGDAALLIMGCTVVLAFVVLVGCGLVMLIHEVKEELKKK